MTAPLLIQTQRQQLIDIKRQLIAARIGVMEASAKARRAENRELAARLHKCEDLLALELDYIEGLLARCEEPHRIERPAAGRAQ